MAILKIARMGHPVLQRRAMPVADPAHPDIQRLVRDMLETMVDAEGTGLAAPQVHVPLRILIFFVSEARTTEVDGDGPVALTTLINPEIELIGDETAVDWEGCLSLPGLTGAVPRHLRVRYRGITPAGETIERMASGFHARVVQHEFDHLEGILYPMRMTDLSQLGFVPEVSRARAEAAHFAAAEAEAGGAETEA
jgi:peptide deformylase